MSQQSLTIAGTDALSRRSGRQRSREHKSEKCVTHARDTAGPGAAGQWRSSRKLVIRHKDPAAVRFGPYAVVALKILPDNVASDGDRVVRFRREAQMLASLNHPRIAAIYGVEDSGATPVLSWN